MQPAFYDTYTERQIQALLLENLQIVMWLASHDDWKSHTGFGIQIGSNSGFIHAKSIKQKCVTTSSTEAELCALEAAVLVAIDISKLFTEFGISHGIQSSR